MDSQLGTQLHSNRNLIILLIAAMAVIVGSAGPWAHVWIVTVNGTAGDGQISLIAGGIAGILAFLEFNRAKLSRGRNIGMLLLFGGAAALGVYHWINLGSLTVDSTFPASLGWGLPVLTVGGVIGAITAFVQLGHVNAQVEYQDADRLESASDF